MAHCKGRRSLRRGDSEIEEDFFNEKKFATFIGGFLLCKNSMQREKQHGYLTQNRADHQHVPVRLCADHPAPRRGSVFHHPHEVRAGALLWRGYAQRVRQDQPARWKAGERTQLVPGTRDGRGLSMFIYDKRDGGVDVRRIENKLGIHGSPTCELVYKNAKCELCGDRKLGLIKYVMALMNGARLGIAAQSVGISQASYNEALAYAKDRKQFGKAIIEFPAVYEMISNIKAKLDAGRALLYQTSRYVDIYKALDDIARSRKLTPEERAEQKKFAKLADAFTPLAKGMNSEYANQNAYDCIQVHGGSGFMLEYACQRLYRDARITSIYEGTTQLQTVAAIRYITNGFYSSVIQDFENVQTTAEFESYLDRIKAMAGKLNESIAAVKEAENQELLDICSRHLYDMTGSIVMSHLLLQNATKAPELFAKSLNVYVNLAESEVEKNYNWISRMTVDQLDSYKK